MTLDRLGRRMVDLIPELARFVPPAFVFDKTAYSPWLSDALHLLLQQRGMDTLVISGAETDVCVLSTGLGAVDHGYRVIIAGDGLCSSSDDAHDALLKLYETRYSQQIETVNAETVLRNWE